MEMWWTVFHLFIFSSISSVFLTRRLPISSTNLIRSRKGIFSSRVLCLDWKSKNWQRISFDALLQRRQKISCLLSIWPTTPSVQHSRELSLVLVIHSLWRLFRNPLEEESMLIAFIPLSFILGSRWRAFTRRRVIWVRLPWRVNRSKNYCLLPSPWRSVLSTRISSRSPPWKYF